MSILVGCGICSACLQERRNYQSMLFRNNTDSYVLFVTLTYSDKYVPFVLLSQISSNPLVVDVFRDSSRIGNFTPDKDFNNDDFNKFSFIHGRNDRIGILWQKDISNFFKRFRKNLSLSFGSTLSSYFYVREYGSNFHRPHFHIAFFIDKKDYQKYVDTVIKSWTMCDWSSLPFDESFKFIPASTTSNYVASYLNKSGCLPLFLQNKAIQQKTWHSHFFGFNTSQFTFDSFFSAAEQHTCIYIKSSVTNGIANLSRFLYPKYVANRYFPKIKGFSRLTYDDFRNIYKFGYSKFYCILLDYNDEDIKRNSVLINRCRSLSALHGVDYDYFLFVFWSYYINYASTLIKLQHQDINGISYPVEHLSTCYFNLAEYFRNTPNRLRLLSFDYNRTTDNLRKHNRLVTQYDTTLFKYRVKSLIKHKQHG